MSSAQPKVTGAFSKSPLLHVLTSLLEQAATGTLVIETANGIRSAIVVERGVPVKVRLGEATLRLGEVLVDLGWLKRDVASSSYDQAVTLGELHGQVLVREGLIDPEMLQAALRTQLVKKLQWVAALPKESVFGLYEGVDYLAKWRGGATPVGPLVVLWALARSRAEPATVATVVSRIAGRVLRLHPNAQLRSFGFHRSEMTLLDALRAKPQTIEALTRMGAVAPHTIERMMYVLTLTRHLDFGLGHMPMGIGLVSEREESLLEPKESLRPSRPVVLVAGTDPAGTLQIGLEDSIRLDRSQIAAAHTPIATAIDTLGATPLPAEVKGAPSANRPSPPAAGFAEAVPPGAVKPAASPARGSANESPAIAERRQQIEKLDSTIATCSYFDVLGVSQEATPSQVQDAYLKAAKSYHPDRLPPELMDLKPQATRIFARMSEAHQTLSDPAKRAHYAEQIDRGTSSDEDEKVRRVLRAAGAFQKAEVLLKKRMMAAAELEANRALEDDPEQADYLALCAWIQVCKPDSEARLPELCKMLTDAVNRNPNSEKNRFYRVQVYKRLGQVDRAVADCRLIVEKNPHHVDAQREIRLWEMRRAPNKQTPARGTIPPRATSTKSSSDRPATSPSAGRKSDPPPHQTGGLLGRLFKR